MNRIQFQAGLSIPEFLQQYGTQAQCEEALESVRWPNGFQCPRCREAAQYVLQINGRKTFQCAGCGHQTSLTAGTVFHSTKLPLTVWFLAILGVSYPTAWMIHHKLMQAMVAREARCTLSGHVQIDDVYLGGERSGGKAGRGSENKVPFVAAVSLNQDGHPVHAKLTPVAGFTLTAIARWAQSCLSSRDTGTFGRLGLLQCRRGGGLSAPRHRRRWTQAKRGS